MNRTKVRKFPEHGKKKIAKFVSFFSVIYYTNFVECLVIVIGEGIALCYASLYI